MESHGIPATIVTKFLSGRRIEIEKTGLYSLLVLFSMGITKGKWSTLVTELINFRDLYEANEPVNRALPAVAAAHPEAYEGVGLRDLCTRMHQAYREHNFSQAQRDMYTALPEMAMRPADAYTYLVRGAVESVDIDSLMGRTVAVMVVPYPPGIPVIMPGEQITKATHSVQEYLLSARDFDTKFPGFETDIHGLRFETTGGKRRYLVDCLKTGARP
jgi:arginine decarboxylase